MPFFDGNTTTMSASAGPGLSGGSADRASTFLKKFLDRQGAAADVGDWTDDYIKGVTQKGREASLEMIKKKIEDVWTKERRTMPSVESVVEAKEALKMIRLTTTPARVTEVELKTAVGVLRVLNSWVFSEALLRTTLVGKEINLPFWKKEMPHTIAVKCKSLVGHSSYFPRGSS